MALRATRYTDRAGPRLCSSMEEQFRPKETVGGSSPSRGTSLVSRPKGRLTSERRCVAFSKPCPDRLPSPVNRLEVVAERPGDEPLAHVPSSRVGEAEMESQPDPGVHYDSAQCAARVVVP